jgi:hypothetical protein
MLWKPYANRGLVCFQVQVQVTLRLTVSQLVSLGIEPPPGVHDQIFIAPRLLRSSFCWAPSLTRGWVFYICCSPLPAQFLSGPSPMELATIFYCLTFETSLFVASYDSQGHGHILLVRTAQKTLFPIVTLFLYYLIHVLCNILFISSSNRDCDLSCTSKI